MHNSSFPSSRQHLLSRPPHSRPTQLAWCTPQHCSRARHSVDLTPLHCTTSHHLLPSCRITSPSIMSHPTSTQFIIFHHIISYHVLSYLILSRLVLSCLITRHDPPPAPHAPAVCAHALRPWTHTWGWCGDDTVCGGGENGENGDGGENVGLCVHGDAEGDTVRKK